METEQIQFESVWQRTLVSCINENPTEQDFLDQLARSLAENGSLCSETVGGIFQTPNITEETMEKMDGEDFTLAAAIRVAIEYNDLTGLEGLGY